MLKLLFTLPIFLLISCGEVDEDALKPPANGAHGEIIVIMEPEHWNGEIGELVESKLNERAVGPYMRPEPMFSYVHTTPERLNHKTQLNRLLFKVMLDPDSTYATTQLLELEDYYAKGQLFILVKDSDLNRIYEFLLNDFDLITDKFNDHEMKSYISQFKNDPNKGIKTKAEELFDLEVSVPSDCKLYHSKEDFLWVKRERSHNVTGNQSMGTKNETYWIQQGILFWQEDYVDPSQLTYQGVMQKRDTILKYNVEGMYDGSYMATEYDPYYAPKPKTFKFNDFEAMEVSGFWKHAGLEGAFGGGPFVQYTWHNTKSNKVVTASVYIYGPGFNKREYIREAYAMLNTIEMN